MIDTWLKVCVFLMPCCYVTVTIMKYDNVIPEIRFLSWSNLTKNCEMSE